MTNKDYTAVVLVVDRSGSMGGIAKSVQETLEEFVSAQLAEPGRLTIDTVFFDTEVEHRATFVDPAKKKLDLELRPRGMTALFDAVGSKIDSFGAALGKLPEDERPGKVIFVIATDGHENSSTDYNQQRIAELIGHQREVYSWDFTFIGANQDAVLTAQGLNIPQGSAITFAATADGAESVINSMSTYVAASRKGFAAGYSAEDRAAAIKGDDPNGALKEALRTSPATIRWEAVRDLAPADLISGAPGKAKGGAAKRKVTDAPKAEEAPKRPRTRKASPKKDEDKK